MPGSRAPRRWAFRRRRNWLSRGHASSAPSIDRRWPRGRPPMIHFLEIVACVALGSALGGSARFFVSGVVGRRIGETFPWGTMTVNVTGAFVMGFLASAAGVGTLLHDPLLHAVAMTGFLGSYTTVSSFSLQTLALARDGEWTQAAANVALSLAARPRRRGAGAGGRGRAVRRRAVNDKTTPDAGRSVSSAAAPHHAGRRARIERWQETLPLYGAVAVGSMIGGTLRFLVSYAWVALAGSGFPVATLLVNVRRLVRHRLLRDADGPRRSPFRRPAPAARLHDRLLRRFHHLLDLQPRDDGADRERQAGGGRPECRAVDRAVVRGGVARPRAGERVSTG